MVEIAKICQAAGTEMASVPPSCAGELPQLGRLVGIFQYTLVKNFNLYNQTLARQLGQAAFEQARKVKETAVHAMEHHTHARLVEFCSGKDDCRGSQNRVAYDAEICSVLPFCQMAESNGLAFNDCKSIAGKVIAEQAKEELTTRCMQEPHGHFYCTELEDQIFQKHPTCYHDLFVQTFHPNVVPRCEPDCVTLWEQAEAQHSFCSKMFAARNRRILKASSALAYEMLAHIKDPRVRMEGRENLHAMTFESFQDTCMGGRAAQPEGGAPWHPMGGRGSRTSSMMV